MGLHRRELVGVLLLDLVKLFLEQPATFGGSFLFLGNLRGQALVFRAQAVKFALIVGNGRGLDLRLAQVGHHDATAVVLLDRGGL